MSQVLTSKYPLFRYEVAPIFSGIYDLDDELELMEFLYRIKMWEVVVNVSQVPGGNFFYNGTYQVPTRATNADGVLTNVPLSERDMVRASFDYGGFITYVTSGTAEFSMEPYSFFEVTRDAGVEIAWRVQTRVRLDETFFGVGPFLLTTEPFIGGVESAADLQIGGHTIPIYEAPVFGVSSGSIIATPIEWWPYAPTSGGLPVFDTATGTQINPNVVID
jgi:hypothetical protein